MIAGILATLGCVALLSLIFWLVFRDLTPKGRWDR